jgi:hypothetical protein
MSMRNMIKCATSDDAVIARSCGEVGLYVGPLRKNVNGEGKGSATPLMLSRLVS